MNQTSSIPGIQGVFFTVYTTLLKSLSRFGFLTQTTAQNLTQRKYFPRTRDPIGLIQTVHTRHRLSK